MPLALSVCWLRHVHNPSTTTTSWYLFISLVAEERIVLHKKYGARSEIQSRSGQSQYRNSPVGPVHFAGRELIWVDLWQIETNGFKWIFALSPDLLLHALGKAWVAYYTKQGKSTKFVWKKHLSRKWVAFSWMLVISAILGDGAVATIQLSIWLNRWSAHTSRWCGFCVCPLHEWPPGNAASSQWAILLEICKYFMQIQRGFTHHNDSPKTSLPIVLSMIRKLNCARFRCVESIKTYECSWAVPVIRRVVSGVHNPRNKTILPTLNIIPVLQVQRDTIFHLSTREHLRQPSNKALKRKEVFALLTPQFTNSQLPSSNAACTLQWSSCGDHTNPQKCLEGPGGLASLKDLFSVCAFPAFFFILQSSKISEIRRQATSLWQAAPQSRCLGVWNDSTNGTSNVANTNEERLQQRYGGFCG